MQPLPSPLSARKVPTHRFTAKTVRVHRQQRALQNRKRTHLKFNPPHLILMPRTVWKHLYYTESTVPSKFRIDERHTDGLGHFGSHFACIFVGLHWCCSNLRRSHYLLSVIFFFPANRINQMWNVQNWRLILIVFLRNHTTTHLTLSNKIRERCAHSERSIKRIKYVASCSLTSVLFPLLYAIQWWTLANKYQDISYQRNGNRKTFQFYAAHCT